MRPTENFESEWKSGQKGGVPKTLDPHLLASAREVAGRLPNLLAYVVIHEGILVDDYFAEISSAQTKHHIRSITKSVTSALVGIAMELGYIQNLDAPVLTYLPEYSGREQDARKAQLTLRHLLTMTAGFTWDEQDSDLVYNWFFDGTHAALYEALDRPFLHNPGAIFNYDSPAADLIAAILARATQRDLQSFAIEHLFGPLGITDFTWETDSAGFYRGSAGLVMRARDIAKLGQLYLQQGRWQERQLIPPVWVEESTRVQVTLGGGAGYGFLWWVRDFEQLHHFSAVGFGGQLLLVVPAPQLVVVAQHEWWQISAETAVSNVASFYNDIFMMLAKASL